VSPLFERFDALLFDLDGVVYVGPHAVPHAPESIDAARAGGVRCSFITNNAARMPAVVAQHLQDLGIACSVDDVVTSPQAAITLLADFVPPGSRVLVIGGSGIADELAARGYAPVRSLDDGPVAVVQGFSPDLGWRDLAEATFAVRAGLPWIATNPDRTFPTPRGAAPGNGALVALVADAAGRGPDAVAGKPEPPLLHEAIARCGAERPLMIGDRLDTDIEAGWRVGIPSLLVLTGVTEPEHILRASAGERPTYLGADLRVLLESYPDVTEVVPDTPDSRAVRCGDSTVALRGGALAIVRAGDCLDVLRAACVLAWSEADVGRPVNVGAILGAVAP
jgi:HAD superfamily hydrolase (TIGR01450 family)